MELYATSILCGCGHAYIMMLSPDDMGVVQAEFADKMCPTCQSQYDEVQADLAIAMWEEAEERNFLADENIAVYNAHLNAEPKKLICKHTHAGCEGSLCDGSVPVGAPDDCERFEFEVNPYLCSRMNATCPKTPTCYSETIDITDDGCSEGMVLCTNVDDESDRTMYHTDDIIWISRKDNYDYSQIPF